MPKFNPLESSFKFIAVSAIFLIWTNFTKEAFNFCWHIVTTSPEKETYKPVTKVMCTECKHFFDDESADEPYICFSCQ